MLAAKSEALSCLFFASKERGIKYQDHFYKAI
jgi:hypothetical protein